MKLDNNKNKNKNSRKYNENKKLKIVNNEGIFVFITASEFLLHPQPEFSKYESFICKDLNILINFLVYLLDDKNLFEVFDNENNYHRRQLDLQKFIKYLLKENNPYPLQMLSTIQTMKNNNNHIIPIHLYKHSDIYCDTHLIIENIKKFNKKKCFVLYI